MCEWVALVVLALCVSAARAGAAGPECPPVGAACQVKENFTLGEFIYNVTGSQVIVNFVDGSYFEIFCVKNKVSLEHPALPRFSSPVRVNTVTLRNCPIPQNRSYAAVVAGLNVTEFSRLVLDVASPESAALARATLGPLAALLALEVYCVPPCARGLALAPDALAGLPLLRALLLNTVQVPADRLAWLPTTLQSLKLFFTGLKQLHVDTMPDLEVLDVREIAHIDVNVSEARALQNLSIMAPNTIVSDEALPPSLHFLMYTGVSKVTVMKRCAVLKVLQVTGMSGANGSVALPGGWVSRCPLLQSLRLTNVWVGGTLPPDLLAGATALQDFQCSKCQLTAVPQTLFDYTRQLRTLDLSYNNLTELPSGLFLRTAELAVLNLSHNNLSADVARALQGAGSLRSLRLSYNAPLADLCDGGTAAVTASGFSRLGRLTALRELYLSGTNVTHMCADWRSALLSLDTLYLTDVPLSVLTFADLQHSGRSNATVKFGTRSNFELLYTQDDYQQALQSSSKASVKVSGTLTCNCQTYWAALAFHQKPKHASVTGLKCGRTPLARVDLDSLLCPAPEYCAPLGLPAACSCGARDDVTHGAVVIVTCRRAGLTFLPRPASPDIKWHLRLPGNNITRLAADNLTANIVELDLSNNHIKKFDRVTAAKLAAIPLQLAGNELDCDCTTFEMRSALLGTTSRLRDARDVVCKGGVRLTAAARAPCPSLAGPAAAVLAVLLVAALVAVVLLARPTTRRWIKDALVAAGWLRPRPEPESDRHRRFDAFVSYAHEDEEFVMKQLQERLEGGARPYRLCLHYRDWAPGEWIPAQIAASVRASRRTLAVVSGHYVRSAWARAEFREAHAAALRDRAPRLVVLLLDEPARLPLDAELSSYVRNNTYVRWGDPFFWDKLRRALAPPNSRPETQPAPEEPAAPAPLAPPAAPAPPAALTHDSCAPPSSGDKLTVGFEWIDIKRFCNLKNLSQKK